MEKHRKQKDSVYQAGVELIPFMNVDEKEKQSDSAYKLTFEKVSKRSKSLGY